LLARSLLFMHPREGCHDDLVSEFERLAVAERALDQDGCLGVELQVPADGAGPVLVTALWEHRDAYSGWLANPWREQATEVIDALLERPPEGVVYDIRVAAGRPMP